MLGIRARTVRALCLLSSAVLLVAVTACGSDGEPDAGASAPSTATPAASVAAVNAVAPTAPVWGFARYTTATAPDNQPSPVPAVDSAGSWQRAGSVDPAAQVTVAHRETGSYRVTFPGIAVPGGRGIPLVTALDSPGAAPDAPVSSCHVVRWDAIGTAEQVDLTCRNAGGVAVDSAFTAMFSYVPDTAAVSPGGAYAYLRLAAESASAATAKPADAYSVSGPGTIEIRRVGIGRYTIDLIGPQFAKNGNNLQVNAVGDSPVGCNALGRNVGTDRQSVFVGCSRGAAGADSPFVLLYTSGHAILPTDATSFAHAFTGVTRPGGPTQQPPIGAVEDAWGWYSANSSGANNQVRRLAVGRYEVILPGVARTPDHIQVTPYGEPSARCSAATGATPATGQPVTVSVRCVNANGRLADSYASIAYVSAPAPAPAVG